MNRLFLVALLLTSMTGQSQTNRYGIWLTPTGSHQVRIYGLAVGIMAIPASPEGTLDIEGMNVEVLPVAVFTMPGSMILTMINVADGGMYAETPERPTTEIHGISIGGGMFETVEMNGLSLNLVNSYVSNSHGTEISFVMNSNYSFSGSQLSMWGNRAVEGKGFQFGMFNSCQSGRVVQLGLLNRIGNRVLPLINLDLKKRNGEAGGRRKKKR